MTSSLHKSLPCSPFFPLLSFFSQVLICSQLSEPSPSLSCPVLHNPTPNFQLFCPIFPLDLQKGDQEPQTPQGSVSAHPQLSMREPCCAPTRMSSCLWGNLLWNKFGDLGTSFWAPPTPQVQSYRRFGESKTIPQQDQVLMSPGSKAAWKTRAASSGAAANEHQSPAQGRGGAARSPLCILKAQFLLSSKISFDVSPIQVKIAIQQIPCN